MKGYAASSGGARSFKNNSMTFSNGSSSNPAGPGIYKVFFKTVPDKEDTHVCNCGKVLSCNTARSGYQNLVTHVQNKHKDYAQICQDALKLTRGRLEDYSFVTISDEAKNSKNIYN